MQYSSIQPVTRISCTPQRSLSSTSIPKLALTRATTIVFGQRKIPSTAGLHTHIDLPGST